MRRLPGRIGFTLIELLLVISIAAVLLAITVPVGKSLMEGNRAAMCTAQMRSIGQVMKAYYQDWEGVPPRYDVEGDGVLDTDEDLSDYPNNVNTADDYMVDGRGLMALVDCEYLSGMDKFHCPSSVMLRNPDDPRRPELATDPTYIQSYSGRDFHPTAPARTSADDAYGTLNQYKYLSFRGVTSDLDPDYRRQLSLIVGGQVVPGWHPDDSTVVFWCNSHEETISEGGFGQYFVLFWDGSVRRMPNYLFHDADGQPTSGLPVAAWRVSPADDPTP